MDLFKLLIESLVFFMYYIVGQFGVHPSVMLMLIV